MQENFPQPGEDDRLKTENEFLKMKLMLEHGAEFGPIDTDAEPDPLLENRFLSYVNAFEQQAANPVYIRVFDKIGQPDHFRPVKEIADADIEMAWETLSAYLSAHNIELNVCSPNISSRELYRFATEELFSQEIDDIRIAGMTTCFIYDEFHPDPIYDNSRTAMEDCISMILAKKPMEWLYNFNCDGLRINEHKNLEAEEFRMIVNKFKLLYDDLDLSQLQHTACTVEQRECIVNGYYSLLAKTHKDSFIISGDWRVIFKMDDQFDFWNICEVEIQGINF